MTGSPYFDGIIVGAVSVSAIYGVALLVWSLAGMNRAATPQWERLAPYVGPTELEAEGAYNRADWGTPAPAPNRDDR